MKLNFELGDALLIVDMQNDFMPDGALGVEDGDQTIRPVNELIALAQEKNLPIFASRDWHPENHCSFNENGGIWPVHCVQNTKGAEFNKDVNLPSDAIVVNKALDPTHEAYSAFEAVSNENGRPFSEILEQHKVKRLWIAGLALEYCVRESVLDAAKFGFKTHVILEATRAIDKGAVERVLQEMRDAGVVIEN